MGTRDPRIDAYIAKSADFAQPILAHVREVVHAACPDVNETMKWSSPHFDYKGMLVTMSAFKAHCAVGFWKGTLIDGLEAFRDGDEDSAGSLGKITCIKDLPSRKMLTEFIEEAMRLNDEGISVEKPKKAAKPEAAVPPALAAALGAHARAKAVFEGFPPGHRREYIDWIVEAKREETRAKRVAQAVEWIAEGRARNWKYGA
jgi:uncharacterized protein YdeI (YjbR/CyaY-like superfamily)